jgi:hypothetical protein
MSKLIFDANAFSLPNWQLMHQSEPFAATPIFFGSTYHVKSQLPLEVFPLFLVTVNGT